MVKKMLAHAGDVRNVGWTPGVGKSPGEGKGNQLQCSCLENSVDRGAWWATVHGVAKSRTRLSDLTHTPETQTMSLLLLLLSRFIHVRICATPWTAAYQAPLSMDFPGKSAGVGCHYLLRNYVSRGSNQGVSSAVFPEAPGETLFLCLFHLLETPRPLTAFRLQSCQEHHSASASVITPPPLTLFPVSLFHI